jgi:hypothetical protein
VPKKPIPTTSQSLQHLITLADELYDYTHKNAMCSDLHRQLADQIRSEISRVIQFKNETVIEKIFEASIVPKMTRLAKVVNFFQSLRPDQAGAQYKSRSRAVTRNAEPPCYTPYRAKVDQTVYNEALGQQHINDLLEILKK